MKTPNSSIEANILKKLEQIFCKSQLEKLSKQTGFIQRERKFNLHLFVVLMVFEVRRVSIESLNDLSVYLCQYGVNITKQGLSLRFNSKAVIFMKELVSQVLHMKFQDYQTIKQSSSFNRIMLKDSTVFQLPPQYSEKYKGPGGAASISGIKLQYEYDLKASCNVSVDIQSSNKSDYDSPFQDVCLNDLCIADLGYFKLGHFQDIIKKEAFFLSRFKYNVSIFTLDNQKYKPIKIESIIVKMKSGDMISKLVYLGFKDKLPVNLILERVPDKIAAEKRRKLKKDAKRKGVVVSEERLAYCDVNAYITNADNETLPFTLIRSIYSLRWQIEIIFKTWKSTFNLNKIKPMKIERFECMMFGTLVKIILCQKIYDYYKTTIWNDHAIELSELKSFKYIMRVIECLKNINPRNNSIIFEKLFEKTPQILRLNCIKEWKKNKQTPMMILEYVP